MADIRKNFFIKFILDTGYSELNMPTYVYITKVNTDVERLIVAFELIGIYTG